MRNEGFSVQVRCDLANVDCHIPACECAACYQGHMYELILKA